MDIHEPCVPVAYKIYKLSGQHCILRSHEHSFRDIYSTCEALFVVLVPPVLQTKMTGTLNEAALLVGKTWVVAPP